MVDKNEKFKKTDAFGGGAITSTNRAIVANEVFFNKEINFENLCHSGLEPRNDDTSLPSYIPTFRASKRVAFTIAEVLIALVIIGFLAILFVSPIIEHYQKRATALKVKKFYNAISQAASVSNVEYSNWAADTINIIGAGGKPDMYAWFNTYLSPNLAITNKQSYNFVGRTNAKAWFSDGTCMCIWHASGTILFTFFTDRNMCSKGAIQEAYDGKVGFLFKMTTNGLVRPYTWPTNASVKSLTASCNNKDKRDHNKSHSCSAVLFKNNWEFPKNYLWHF